VKYGNRDFKDGSLDGVHGIIRELQASRQMLVKLNNGETCSVPIDFLQPVRPEKRHMVKILDGDSKDKIGSLISVDGADGVVKLLNGSEFKVMPMSILAKYVAP
jgi:transcription elongation factor SPT5